MPAPELFQALEAMISDPTVTGVSRSPMRTPWVPFPDLDSARSDDPSTSPWWRSLDGTWDLAMFESLAAVPAGALTADPATDGECEVAWSPIEVPGAWTTQRDAAGERFVAPHYTNVVMPFDADPPEVPPENPVGVHRRVVSVPRDWSGRRVVLRVGAAESALAVYVDGHFVGGGTDSRLANEFDITERVRPGRRCTIVLVVARFCAATWLEDQDQWWHGGIQRSVALYSMARSYLVDVAARPGLSAPDVGTLDLELTVAGPAAREPGWTVEATVEQLRAPGRRGRTLAGTGALAVPVWDASSDAAQLIGGMFVRPGVVGTELSVPGIRPWNHEDPQRYRLVVTLRAPDGSVVEATSRSTGFRSVEVCGNELLVNGEPVLVHGVNLHEHDPQRGRAVPAELTRRDLELMKAHNLNAVRAAHYPHDEHLAELCDELGLYLVDEANVESHARQASLCHDPRYTGAIVERVQRMVLRDQGHPSIILWSLGNESGDGAAHAAAAGWVRRHDPSRALHYEGPLMHDLYAAAPETDVVCPMYAPIDDIVAWAESGRDDRRPLILCEYSHAMGNSNGSLSDYWAAIESTHGLQGGFIWEWLDHGLERDPRADGTAIGTGPGGVTSWGYGGDFGDHPNDANFICDGLVSADRTPHPAMREVHWVGRPVSVEWVSETRRRLVVTNRRWFTGLEDLRAIWALRIDGRVVDRGELHLPEVAPRGSATIPSPVRSPRVPPGAEVHLDVEWSLRRAVPWAPKGHVVSFDQLEVTPSVRPMAAADMSAPSSAARSTARSDGQPDVRVGELDWRPTIFRALTDNDGIRQSWMRSHIGQLRRWIDVQGLDRCTWADGPGSGELRAPGVDDPVVVQRTLGDHPDGWTEVRVMFRLPAALADPPRLGTEWILPGMLDRVEWFGDGPHECYPDRRSAATVGHWDATVDSMYTDYAVPQEHGHRTGVRWVALRGGDRSRAAPPGWLVVAEQSFGGGTIGMGVRRHSDDELWCCTHTDELATLTATHPKRTVMYLDVAQRGLGTGSCGPDALDRYRIAAGRHELRVWFRSLGPREDPAVLARSVRSADR